MAPVDRAVDRIAGASQRVPNRRTTLDGRLLVIILLHAIPIAPNVSTTPPSSLIHCFRDRCTASRRARPLS